MIVSINYFCLFLQFIIGLRIDDTMSVFNLRYGRIYIYGIHVILYTAITLYVYCCYIVKFSTVLANTIRINSPTHKEILLFALGKAAWVLLKIVIPLVCLHWKAVVSMQLLHTCMHPLQERVIKK